MAFGSGKLKKKPISPFYIHVQQPHQIMICILCDDTAEMRFSPLEKDIGSF